MRSWRARANFRHGGANFRHGGANFRHGGASFRRGRRRPFAADEANLGRRYE